MKTLTGIILGMVAAFSVYAANPASKEYVDNQDQKLQTQINNIISPTTYTIGQQALGGTIFYLDSTNQHGLVVALSPDQASSVNWAALSGQTAQTNALGNGIGAGKTNTPVIIAVNNSITSAALTCAKYSIQPNGTTACSATGTIPSPSGQTCYADWYLPSVFELALWYQSGVSSSNTNSYWSSTEVTSIPAFAWTFNFSNGSQNNVGKSGSENVRCIRAF